jgi:HK97 family phage major capsid protein
MNLKKYFDKANAAEAKVKQIAAQIDELFDAGKTEDALKLKAELESAKTEAKDAHELYLLMQDAAGTGEGLVPARGVQVVTDEADQPFASAGEFFQAVKSAAVRPAREDTRLRSLKNATGMSEGVPADGGYLIPKEYASGILERMYATGEILSRIAKDPVTGNSMSYNAVDESSRVAGSQYGGVVGYWLNEAGQITGSKPKFRQFDLKLKKVGALAYATDEQISDTGMLESWIGRTVPNVLRFMAEDAIYEGDGVGKPLGIMNSPCLVSVTRDTGSRIMAADIAAMWARRWAGVSDYVWLINQDAVGQLDLMTIGSYWPAFSPAGGLSGQPYNTLKGKPVIEVEYAASLNTTGDIMLASLSQYQAITKGDVATATSIHVAFTTDEQAFRFIYRIDGEPSWDTALTPLHGSNTQSPFVVLGSAT